MTRSVLARLFLVVVLLASWQAALVHPLEHVDEHGRWVHVDDGRERHDGSPSDPSAKLCDALSALTACAPGKALDALLAAAASRQFHFAAERMRRADPPPFLSQGPPALL